MNIHPLNLTALDHDDDRVVQGELFLIGAITGRITEDGIPESRMMPETDYPYTATEEDFFVEPDGWYSPSDREYFADQAEDRETRWRHGE